MTQYEPYDEGVEVRGETILVIEAALSRFSEQYQQQARCALVEYGIEDPDADEWYPQEAELRALETIDEALEPHILDRVGEQIPDAAEWPSDIEGVEAIHRRGLSAQPSRRGHRVLPIRENRRAGRNGRVSEPVPL